MYGCYKGYIVFSFLHLFIFECKNCSNICFCCLLFEQKSASKRLIDSTNGFARVTGKLNKKFYFQNGSKENLTFFLGVVLNEARHQVNEC